MPNHQYQLQLLIDRLPAQEPSFARLCRALQIRLHDGLGIRSDDLLDDLERAITAPQEPPVVPASPLPNPLVTAASHLRDRTLLVLDDGRIIRVQRQGIICYASGADYMTGRVSQSLNFGPVTSPVTATTMEPSQ